MKLIEIAALGNGAHRNQTVSDQKAVPDGWAVIPDDVELHNFPFGQVEAAEIEGVMTVVKWTPGEYPEPEEAEEEPSQLDVMESQVFYTAMMTDTLLEV